MENPDSQDDRPANRAPAPTHWNVFRDPQWSFACPKCKAHVQFGVIDNPFPGFPPMMAVCWDCETAYSPDVWEKTKIEDMYRKP